jgi:hypothetical protein
MAAVFIVLSVIAGVWSAVTSEIIYRKLIDTFPPQFQENVDSSLPDFLGVQTSRYAFHVYALISTHAVAAASAVHEIAMDRLRLLPLRRAGLFLSFKCPVRLHLSRGLFLDRLLNNQVLEDLQGKLQSGRNQGCRNGLDAA